MASPARTRRRRRRLYKKKQNEESPESSTTTTSKKIEGGEEEEESSSRNCNGCCTPKGKRFRIPEILTCPPAPKKRRAVQNCLTKKSPIPFFASPDIELFFFFAFRNPV